LESSKGEKYSGFNFLKFNKEFSSWGKTSCFLARNSWVGGEFLVLSQVFSSKSRSCTREHKSKWLAMTSRGSIYKKMCATDALVCLIARQCINTVAIHCLSDCSGVFQLLSSPLGHTENKFEVLTISETFSCSIGINKFLDS